MVILESNRDKSSSSAVGKCRRRKEYIGAHIEKGTVGSSAR